MRSLSSNYQRTVIDFCKNLLEDKFAVDTSRFQVCVEPTPTSDSFWDCVFMKDDITIVIPNIAIHGDEVVCYGESNRSNVGLSLVLNGE